MKDKNLQKIKLILKNLSSSTDFNKKIEEIGKSINKDHIELQDLLIQLIHLVYDIRFDTKKEKEAIKILEKCKFDLIYKKWS